MKSNELMIGDWVCIGEGNCQVSQIREDGIMTEAYNDIYEDEWVEPIPLTAEILKKNGWEMRYTYWGGRKKKEYNLSLDKRRTILLQGGGKIIGWMLMVNSMPYFQGTIHSVHELQHALRLCGLDELADNFKV